MQASEIGRMQDRVIEMTAEHLGESIQDVRSYHHFRDDLGADSLDVIELVMAFEDEFGVRIPDEEADKIITVHQAMDAIQYKLEE